MYKKRQSQKLITVAASISVFAILPLIFSTIFPLKCLGGTTLYGRIEQISAGTGASFPVAALKAQTPKMDTRQKIKIRQTGEANFSGSLVRSFPQQFTGIWGGKLKIWTSQMDPICWQIDSDEANQTRRLLTPGREGNVNFDFAQDKAGNIELEPAQIVFMVPIKETHAQEEMNGLLKGDSGQLAGLSLPGLNSSQVANMMQQVVSNMNIPVMINFGAINSEQGVEGVSGNSLRAVVMKNSIRQLSPGILEQQIITQEVQRIKKTGKIRQEYAETVIRFTSQGPNSLYVQAAAVNYTADRKFERKLIVYGTVRRGQAMPGATNPLGGLNNMMPGGSQLPQLPGGRNPLQDLFPQ